MTELSTSAEGSVTFVVPSVLVPRYGGDINNEPFDYKKEGNFLEMYFLIV